MKLLEEPLIHLYDNGAGADSIAGDGIYSGVLDNSGINYTGNYHVKVICTGTFGQDVSFQRAVEQDFNITNFIDGMYLNTIALDSYGNAGSWGDFDADGDQDLAIINNSANIYENDNGHFIQRYSWPVLPKGPGLCATWGDYNNDGNLDIYIGTVGKNLLYKNLGDNQGFVNVQDTTSGLTNDAVPTLSCSWVDYDNDGNLDLFCANDGLNKMYRNNGDGTFSNVSSLGDLGVEEYVSSSCEWIDYNNDGYMDVAIANKNGPDYIMQNGGGTLFHQLFTPALSDVIHHTTTLNWVDYNNDGNWDLFTASDSLLQLFENTGNNSFTYHQLPSDTLHPLVGSRCSSWGDYDNDGKIDLFVGGDAQNDLLFKNSGDNNFQVIKDFLINYYSLGTHSTSWCDFDSDGDLDLLKVSSIGVKLYKNEGNNNRWVSANCVADESQCPQLETVAVLKGDVDGEHVKITRIVSAQTGKAAQNDLRIHFGVGDMQTMDTLRITWPSGIVNEYYNLPTNIMYNFSENRRIIGGTLNTDLLLNDNIHVIEQLIVPQDVTLSITPGCLIAFDDNTGIDVKGGKIDILGTSQSPVTMFSNSSNPVPGIWKGLSIVKSPEAVVHFVEIRDAKSGIAFYGDQQVADLSSINLHDNGTGIYLESSTKNFTIINSHIYNNENFGIWSIMSSVDIMESQIENNAMGGIYSFRKTLMTISNSQIIGNGFAGNENYDGIIAIDGSDLKIFGIESGNPDSCRHNNIIAQNAHAGIHATENAFPLLGIYDPAQPEKSGGYNRIYGNDVSIYNENKEPLYAQVNYWNLDNCEQSTPNKLIGDVKWEPSAPVFQGMTKIANYTDTLQLAIRAEISNNISDALNLYRYLIRSYPDSDWVSIPLNGFRRIVNILNPTPATIIDSLNFYRNTFPNTQLAKWALDETIQPLLELEQYSQALLVLDTLEELWSSTTRIPIYWYERGRISDYLQGQSLDKPSNATVKLYQKILEIYPDSPVAIQVKVRLTIDPSQTPGNKEKIPDTFDLQPPYPNPFNGRVHLKYGLPEGGKVYIAVYDLIGRKISNLVNEYQPAGYKEIIWDGRDNLGKLSSSGVYIILIRAGRFNQAVKVLYLK
ncbi:MAG: FG-GAP-like repeat-containing protein [Candidatus Marinimicrobia bacterium]|nr:FG-GAP-like repeat-containing protein [Candidatus Neomarinimicrobiota bacterium]